MLCFVSNLLLLYTHQYTHGFHAPLERWPVQSKICTFRGKQSEQRGIFAFHRIKIKGPWNQKHAIFGMCPINNKKQEKNTDWQNMEINFNKIQIKQSLFVCSVYVHFMFNAHSWKENKKAEFVHFVLTHEKGWTPKIKWNSWKFQPNRASFYHNSVRACRVSSWRGIN